MDVEFAEFIENGFMKQKTWEEYKLYIYTILNLKRATTYLKLNSKRKKTDQELKRR
jgi:hypothetical protein